MSKRETPLTVAYWHEVGGALVAEFAAVRRGADRGQRLIDAVILLDGEHRIAKSSDPDTAMEGRPIMVIQTKDARLGMNLLGQALFSRELLRPFGPSSIRTVALCTQDDAVLRPLAEAHGIEVVIRQAPPARKGSRPTPPPPPSLH